MEKLSKPTRMAANPPIFDVFVTAVAKEIQRNVELDLHIIKKTQIKTPNYLFHHLFDTKQML